MRSRFLKEWKEVVELPTDAPSRSLDDGFGGGFGRGYGSSSYGSGGSGYGSGGYGSSSYGSGYGKGYGGYNRNVENDEDNYVSYGNQSYSFSRKTTSSGYGARPAAGGSSAYGGNFSSYGSGGSSGYGSGAKTGVNSYMGGSSNGGATRSAYGGVGASKPKPTASKDISGFKTGVAVTHPKFGQGTIVNVRGSGSTTILDIAFAGYGIKQLSASLAPLDIVK